MTSAWLLPLGVVLELGALLGHLPPLSWAAALAFSVYFLLYFRRLNPYPRWLGIVTLAVLGAALWFARPDRACGQSWPARWPITPAFSARSG